MEITREQTMTLCFTGLIFIVGIFPAAGEGLHEQISDGIVVERSNRRSPLLSAPPPPPVKEFRFEIGAKPKDNYDAQKWATRYADFINTLRREMAPEIFYRNAGLLPPERSGEPERWIDIVLVGADGQQSVTLRLRGDNVYLVGFRQGNDGRWFEFTDDNGQPQQLIPESTSLHFGGSYLQLQRAADQRILDNVPVGYGPLQGVVEALNRHTTGQGYTATAQALQVAIAMFSEAIRFSSVMNFVRETANSFYNVDRGSILGQYLPLLIHTWGWLSEQIGRILSATPPLSLRLPDNQAGINTVEEAAEEVRAMLHCAINPISKSSSSSFLSDSNDAEDDEQCLLGEVFLEVVLVRIQEIKGADQGRIYGTVSVSNSLTRNRLIYDRSAGASEKIVLNDENRRNIRLSDPDCLCIPAADSFTVRVNLLEYLTDTFTSRGTVSWNVFDVTNKYNERLSQGVGGPAGSAVVEYIVYNNAVQAAVEIKLLSSSYERRVFGTIAMSNVKYGVQYDLFNYSRLEPVSIASQQKFPLLRRAIAVPLDSSFTLDGKLSEYDLLLRPQPFANFVGLEFAAKINGKTEKTVKAAGGSELRILVKWNDISCHDYDLIHDI